MFDLSANSDFKDTSTKIASPFLDFAIDCNTSIEIYGFDVIDQWIEHILCTIPGERLFNLDLGSPLYKILFENCTTSEAETIFNQVVLVIENWISDITIDTSSSNYNFDELNHTFTMNFIYYSKKLAANHQFSRRIRQ